MATTYGVAITARFFRNNLPHSGSVTVLSGGGGGFVEGWGHIDDDGWDAMEEGYYGA